jgi:hypothetical protein
LLFHSFSSAADAIVLAVTSVRVRTPDSVRLSACAAALATHPCSLFGQDVLEFVIKPEQPSGQLVTYRSMAGT